MSPFKLNIIFVKICNIDINLSLYLRFFKQRVPSKPIYQIKISIKAFQSLSHTVSRSYICLTEIYPRFIRFTATLLFKLVLPLCFSIGFLSPFMSLHVLCGTRTQEEILFFICSRCSLPYRLLPLYKYAVWCLI